MQEKHHTVRRRVPSKFLRALVFCVICILTNAIGSQLATLLRLPIYLDCWGTFLAAMIGGYIPSIIVGYATNLLNAVYDTSFIYYGIVSVCIAISTAFFAQHGWFQKLSRTLLAILILGLLSGLLGSVITYLLHGGNIGDGVSAPFAQQLYQLGAFDLTTSQVLGELFVNLIDKAFVVLSATLAYHMMSESFLESFDFVPWQQTPLTDKQLSDAMSEKPRVASLGTKVVVLIATIVVTVAVATTVFSHISYHRSMIEAESTKAEGVTSLMESVVDPNMVPIYLEQGDNAPGYQDVEASLADIRDSFESVQYVYVYQIKPDGCHVVIDPDTADTPGSDPGEVIPFDKSFMEVVPTLLAGGEIDPIISNDTYGWLLTVYRPLKDFSGETVCYLAADISMERLTADEYSFLAGIIALFAAFFILVCAIVLWLSRYNVIVPVNSIARAASGFVLTSESTRSKSLDPIKRLGIHTGDEIENLYTAITQLSQDAVRYIDEAQDQSETIARMQSNLIMVMADLVESRDKFTGDHVRNTAAYTRIIMNQMRREGIRPDVLTNEFISNVYQSAPLHDIGKIAVSDLILNKPGRLTDEEFEIMKSHTVVGQQILESAKGAVSESSYLDEAQRLAAYHHEKWDGSGYPFGLAGEDIPLSARIMAVADVFDALVSKRSYKAGFPIEKAFAIIEEGIGTHFDPQVARAFLHARDKARSVAEKSNEKKQLEEEAAQRKEADSGPDASTRVTS